MHVGNFTNVVELLSPQEGEQEIDALHLRSIGGMRVSPLMNDAL